MDGGKVTYLRPQTSANDERKQPKRLSEMWVNIWGMGCVCVTPRYGRSYPHPRDMGCLSAQPPALSERDGSKQDVPSTTDNNRAVHKHPRFVVAKDGPRALRGILP